MEESVKAHFQRQSDRPIVSPAQTDPAVLSGSPSPRLGKYRMMIFTATLIWGFSFLFVKDIVEVVSPTVLVGWRFFLASGLMFLVFHRRIRATMDRSTLAAGVTLGVLYYLAFWAQTIGITDTTPGKNAFLTGASCVMVPFIYWLISKRRPTIINILTAIVCFVGIGLVSLEDTSLSLRFGDAMTLLGAVFFAGHIAFLGRFAGGKDVMSLTFLQFFTTGVLGIIGGGLESGSIFFSEDAGMDIFAKAAFLTVFSTFGACTLQNAAQVHIPPNQTALILSLESVFGVLFSVLLYGEMLTLRVIIGFAVIFAAIVASETLATKEFSWLKKTTSS